MKPPGHSPEQHPKLYSISAEEFKMAPTELQPYKPGEKVTRDNFVNFLILSFGISMGQPKVQILFMRWLRLKFGFNYQDAIKNFHVAGGWKILSEYERKEFKQQYLKVAKHGRDREMEIDNEIGAEIERLCKNSDSSFYRDPISDQKITDIYTFPQFAYFAHQMVTQIRAERSR